MLPTYITKVTHDTHLIQTFSFHFLIMFVLILLFVFLTFIRKSITTFLYVEYQQSHITYLSAPQVQKLRCILDHKNNSQSRGRAISTKYWAYALPTVPYRTARNLSTIELQPGPQFFLINQNKQEFVQLILILECSFSIQSNINYIKKKQQQQSI